MKSFKHKLNAWINGMPREAIHKLVDLKNI